MAKRIMKTDHFSNLSGTGSLQDSVIRFKLFNPNTKVGSSAQWSNVETWEWDYSQSLLNVLSLKKKIKWENIKVHSIKKKKQEGEYKTLLRKHGAATDEKRMCRFPFPLDALIKITYTADTLQLPAPSL